MKKPLLFFIAILMVITGSCQQSAVRNNAVTSSLSTTEFAAGINKANVLLLDVRTPDEYAGGHIKGAINIDYNNPDFEKEIQKLNKENTVYVYCLAGSRSANSMEILADAGFREIYNMEGGTLKWIAEGKPLITTGNVLPKSGGMTAQQYVDATRSAEIVIMDFNAAWCGPCKQLAPVLEQLEKDLKGRLKVVAVDVDANRTLAQSKSVSNIPFLEIYKNGKLTMQHEGLTTYEELFKILPL